MTVDSKKQKLNLGQIVLTWLQSVPQPHPINVMSAAILAELSHPNVKTKQFGNTLFEIIEGADKVAYVKAFNADIGVNFVENSKLFLVYAKNVLNLKHLVVQSEDPSIEQLLKIIKMNPPISNFDYTTQKIKSGETRFIINLGG